MYIYIYILEERERQTDRHRGRDNVCGCVCLCVCVCVSVGVCVPCNVFVSNSLFSESIGTIHIAPLYYIGAKSTSRDYEDNEVALLPYPGFGLALPWCA